MNKLSKKRTAEARRIQEGVNNILALLNDKNFMESLGLYMKVGDSFILPKFQDVIYEKRHTIDVNEVITDQQDYLRNNISKGLEGAQYAIYFLLPINSIIALPPNYTACRAIAGSDEKLHEALSITLVNGMENTGKGSDDTDIFHSLSFVLVGYYSRHKVSKRERLDIYLKCIGYLNDFITAYKLYRHDHTIHNVTPRTLPEMIGYYTQSDGDELSDEQFMIIHGNDLMDLWTKRLPEDPEKFVSEFRELCEHLPTYQVAHYALRLGEKSVTNYCLGQYEDSVLNGDRYVELALRDILRNELDLDEVQLSEYKDLYSTNPSKKAVIQTLADHLGCKGNAIISQWYEKSRKLRNDIVHKLSVEGLNPDNAQDALKYNMQLVDLMADNSQYDFEWYRLIPKSFSELFGQRRKR